MIRSLFYFLFHISLYLCCFGGYIICVFGLVYKFFRNVTLSDIAYLFEWKVRVSNFFEVLLLPGG